jgi:Phosphotransferase enzyme family
MNSSDPFSRLSNISNYTFLLNLINRPKVLDILEKYCSDLPDVSILSPPFHLIHPDLEPRNILISHSSEPVISAILDWEHVMTGPRYYFYEYPPFIQFEDFPMEGEELSTNAILRQHFETELMKHCRSDEQRRDVEDCMKKNYVLSGFKSSIMGCAALPRGMFERVLSGYIIDCEAGREICYQFQFPEQIEKAKRVGDVEDEDNLAGLQHPKRAPSCSSPSW